MADKKITQLPSLSFISGSTTGYYAGEVVLPIVHNSTTVKMEAQKFALYATQWSATTASNTFIGNQTINGNVVVTGKLTAQEVHTEITSASIIFESGSTIFGNTADDTHTITGTININGNVVGNAPLDFTSQSLNIATGSYNRLYDMTSSVHFTTASLNTQTGSQQLINVQNSTVTSSLNLATASLNFTTGALNIASGSYNRLYQVTSSVHSTTASLNQATSSLNFASGALEIATGSYNRFYDMTSSVHFTTQSLNVQTGSQESINVRISSTTGSINTTTSSFDSVFLRISSTTGSINTTTSSFDSVFLGISSVTGAINTQSSSQDLVNFRNSTFTSSLNFATASLNSFTGSIISQTNTIATFTSSVNFATSSLNTQTGSQDLVNRGISSVTGSMNTQSSSQDLVNYQNSIVTSSFRNEIGGIEAYTASLKSAIVVNGSNVRIIGELTASRIYTEFITSSVLFVTGSNIIGDQSSDKHEFTGSVNINDTLFIKGQAIGLGELNAFTGSQINKDFTLSKVTASIDAHILGISTYTSSTTIVLNSIDAHILKQSIQTGSQDLVNLGISTYTGSQNVINSSVDSHILKQATQTGSQDLVNFNISVVTSSIDSHILKQATQTGSQDLVNYNISIVTSSIDVHILKQATQTGSQDLVNLGISTFTGSLRSEVDLIEAYTASIKGAAIVSSSQQITNYYKFAETASANTFYGNQTINGTLGVSIGGIEAMVLTSDGYLGIGKNSLNVSVDDLIGLLAFKSNDTSTNSAGAISSIRSYATANYNTGDVEGDMRFYVSNGSTPAGSLLSGNEHTRLTKDGYLRLAGGGIQFNGDTAAANSLDDYEEGTWTPIDSSGASLTFTVLDARYTKIGRQVQCFAQITYPTTANGSDAKIGGLPFTMATTTGGSYGAFITYTNIGSNPTFLNNSNTTNTSVYTNAGVAITNATLSEKQFRLVWIYEA
jgi:hypothetical protein